MPLWLPSSIPLLGSLTLIVNYSFVGVGVGLRSLFFALAFAVWVTMMFVLFGGHRCVHRSLSFIGIVMSTVMIVEKARSSSLESFDFVCPLFDVLEF